MESQVTELSPVLVEVNVEVPWDHVQRGLDENVSKLARTARIKGFRQGKVPKDVVRRLFAHQIRNDVTTNLVERNLFAAIEKHQLHIVAEPEVRADDIEDGKALKFTAKLEVRPKIERVQTDGLVVSRPKVQIGDDELDKELERLRAEHATLRAPEPMRGAVSGDTLLVDYTMEIDGVQDASLKAEGRNIELGDGRLLAELDRGLLGVQPGERRDIEVQFAADHGNAKLRGKTVVFHVDVKELQEKLLPALDDEFAKDLGQHETLDALRASIRSELEAERTRRGEAELRDQVVDRLVEANDIPLPPSLVQQQEKALVEEFLRLVQMTGQRPPNVESMMAGFRARAERRVRAGLLLGALAAQESISVSEEDVNARFAEIAEATGKHVAKVRVDHQGERRQQLENQILERKLLDLLLGRARIEETDPASNDAPAESAAT